MVGEPVDVEVDDLEFDQENEAHLLRHEVSRADVVSVLGAAPRYFENLPDRTGSHVMIGPNSKGTFFLVVISPTGKDRIWHPVTGWKLGRGALALYNKGRQE